MKTYEERVQEVITFLDTELHDDIFIEDARCIAERFVDEQAEAIREQLQPYMTNGYIDNLLIQNGYSHATERTDNT